MNKKVLVFVLMVLLIGCGAAEARQNEPATLLPLVLTDEQGRYSLGSYLEILEDSDGELTIQDVTSPEFDRQFIPGESDAPNFGYTQSAYWVRVNLLDEAPQTDRWLLDMGYAMTHYVDLYSPGPSGDRFIVKEGGFMRPPGEHDLRHPRTIFVIELPPGATQSIYLRVQSGSSMSLPLTIWNSAELLAHTSQQQTLHALYFGILLGLLAYNFFLLVSLRDVSHLYLVILMANMVFFEASYLGYMESYFMPSFYFLKPYYFPLSFSLIFLSMVLFADAFLDLKTANPRFHQTLIIIVAVWGLLICLIPFITYHTIAALMIPWALVSLTAVLVTALFAWWKGYRSARFFIVAWFGLLAAFILVLLVRIGAMPSTLFTENAYRLGMVWMAVCWSIALADRLNLLRSKIERANHSLHSSEHRLTQILEGLPLAVAVYGPDYRPNYVNRRAVEILSNPARNIQPDLSAGRTLTQAMDYFSFQIAGTERAYPLDAMPVYQALQGEPASADDIEADLDDKRVPLEVWASPVVDASGTVESAIVVFQDITRRRSTEAELAQYRSHLEELVEQRTKELNEINTLLSQEVAERKSLAETQFKLIEWLSVMNQLRHSLGSMADLPQAYEQLLITAARLLDARSAFIWLWEDHSDKTHVLCWLRGEEASGVVRHFSIDWPENTTPRREILLGEHLVMTVDKTRRMLAPLRECLQVQGLESVTLTPIRNEESVSGLFGLGLQREVEAFPGKEAAIIDRITLDLGGLAQQALLNEQAQALVAVEERTRLARDLHDSVTQVLFSASLVGEILPRIWRRDPDQALQSLDDLRRLTRGALAEMRTMLLELRPHSIYQTPLHEVLAQLTEAVTSRTELPIQLFIEQTPILPGDVQMNFYRIAQEALNNIVKHSQASEVEIHFSATPLVVNAETGRLLEVKLVISDNGIGYSKEDLSSEHMGLTIMQERASAIDARLLLNSDSCTGTRVTLVWQGETEAMHE